MRPTAPAPAAPSEFVIYTAVWELQSATLRQIRDRLADSFGVTHPAATVEALCARLVKKGWLRTVGAPRRGTLAFAPALPYAEAVGRHFRRFLGSNALDGLEAFAALRDALDAAEEAAKHRLGSVDTRKPPRTHQGS